MKITGYWWTGNRFLSQLSGERKIQFKITQLSEENIPKVITQMADSPEQAEAHREFLNGFMFSSLYTDTEMDSFLNILQDWYKVVIYSKSAQLQLNLICTLAKAS